jgi:glycosyltransferase involved in cell wall biosynthesis
LTSRVLFLEHNTDGTVGGSHFCLLEICRGLDRQLFEPVVWFYQENSLIDEFRATGAEVIVRPPSARARFSSSGAGLRRLLAPAQSFANAYGTLVRQSRTWAAELRRLKIDIVHLNNGCGYDHDLLVGALRRGIPCVAHQRGFPSPAAWIDRRLTPRFARIIAISTAVAAGLRDKGIATQRVALVHDGIDPDRITAQADARGVRTALGIPGDAPIVGVVGNVKTWKGQLTLVRAMRRIVQSVAETRCLIVGALGDAAYYGLLKAEVANANLQDRVFFTDYQRYPARYMSAMDVVVHTSIEPEPFGIVILEGMALRKPVIATAHGGPLDVIDHGVTGFLTAPGNDAELAEAVCRLLSNTSLREAMGNAARSRLENHFSARRNVERLQELYQQISPAR